MKLAGDDNNRNKKSIARTEDRTRTNVHIFDDIQNTKNELQVNTATYSIFNTFGWNGAKRYIYTS